LPQTRLTSGVDFPESMADKKLRVSIFVADDKAAVEK
jgi:hypothetical protein